jgi:hypothetical protein
MTALFRNPQHAASNTLFLCCGLIAIGAAASLGRIQTVYAERERQTISDVRTQSCRILNKEQKLKVGYYYFQPSRKDSKGGVTGDLLSEGTYICDWYGNSVRVDANGAVDHFVVADAATQNAALKERLKDESNPDRSEMSQVREATNIPPDFGKRLGSKPQPQKKDGFFDPVGKE